MHPRDYLSYSQMTLWEKNPDKYIEQYLYGEKSRTSRAMALGKEMARGLEEGDDTGDPVLDLVMARLPKYECRDKEFRGTLKGKDFDVPLLIRPDSAKKDLSRIIEYKTGLELWTASKVAKLDQLDFYMMGAFVITGKLPVDLKLVHVQTERECDGDGEPLENGRILPTGKFFEHKATRTMADVLRMMTRARKAWREIGERYEQEII